MAKLELNIQELNVLIAILVADRYNCFTCKHHDGCNEYYCNHKECFSCSESRLLTTKCEDLLNIAIAESFVVTEIVTEVAA